MVQHSRAIRTEATSTHSRSIMTTMLRPGLSVVEYVWRVKIESKDPEALQLKVQVVPVEARLIHLQIYTCIRWTLEPCLGPSAEVEAASFTYKVNCRL
jgi:hypothetical protein